MDGSGVWKRGLSPSSVRTNGVRTNGVCPRRLRYLQTGSVPVVFKRGLSPSSGLQTGSVPVVWSRRLFKRGLSPSSVPVISRSAAVVKLKF